MDSRFRIWQREAGLTNERICNNAKAIDPTGKGITIRSLTNFKRTGSCHLRTAYLLIAAHGDTSGVFPALQWEDLDAEGLLELRA